MGKPIRSMGASKKLCGEIDGIALRAATPFDPLLPGHPIAPARDDSLPGVHCKRISPALPARVVKNYMVLV
jgi:hypothetical protein